MIDITFTIGGRSVPPDGFGDALMKAGRQAIVDEVTAALKSVRCPIHGQQLRVKVTGPSIDRLKFEVTACCQELADNAAAKLK